MQPSDLFRIVTPSDPRLKGDRVAFVQTRLDLDSDRYVREIWIDDPGGRRRLTSGPGDSSPRWSPDGSRLAFLRAKDDKPAQVASLPVDGGEGEVVTDFSLGVEELEWSPDGTRLAVIAVTWTDEWEGLGDAERERRPRRITSVPFRFDGKGWTHDRRRHVWLVDLSGQSAPECLTPGDYDESGIAWSPDGSRIAFISDRDPRRGLEPGTDVWELDADGDRSPRRVPERGDWSAVTYRPDGILHLVGHRSPRWPNVSRVYRCATDGSLEDLTGELDRSVIALSAAPRFVWVGQRLHTLVEDSGSVGVIAIEEDGSIETLVAGERTVTGFDVDGERMVHVASTSLDPGALFVATPAGERRIGDAVAGDLGLVDAHHFRVESDDTEIDVWVYLPAGDDPVPVLLNIHGGPAGQYGFGFFDEFQVYTGAGFGVVACNPRGSSGRGTDFVRAVVGDGWGVVDVADVTAALEAAVGRFPRLDASNMGVMGGSYGGFLTSWITARDHRFRSAVVERALTSWPSFAGTSDIGGVFPSEYTGADYPAGWDDWWAKSPMATAHLVRTPTLVLHAESDHRCPIEQAEQYFMALLRNGTPTELLRFPGEGHEMSRSGKPSRRVERFDAVIGWHRRWLDPREPDSV